MILATTFCESIVFIVCENDIDAVALSGTGLKSRRHRLRLQLLVVLTGGFEQRRGGVE